MKSQHLLSIFVLSGFLLACTSSNKPVTVVKEPEKKTEYQPNQIKPVEIPYQSLPANVTAICNDGSYSTSHIQEACLGNGGVKQGVIRYHAD